MSAQLQFRADLKWSQDGEFFNEDSLHQLILDYDLSDGDVVWYGEAEPHDEKSLVNYLGVEDWLSNAAADLVGEAAEDYPPRISKEAEAELEAALLAWLTKHAPFNYWSIAKPQEYTVTIEDVSAALDPGPQEPRP